MVHREFNQQHFNEILMKEKFEMFADKQTTAVHQKETLLLAQHNLQDREHVKILEDMGWNEPLRVQQEELNLVQEKIHAHTNLGQVLTFDEAEKIALANCCVILPYDQYVGPVNKKLTDALKEMCEENNISTSQVSALNGIYIIAPLHYFSEKKAKNEKRKFTEDMYPTCILYKVSDHKTYSSHYYKVYGNVGKVSSINSIILNLRKFFTYTDNIPSLGVLTIMAVITACFYLIVGIPSFFNGVSYGKFELLSASFTFLKWGSYMVMIGMCCIAITHDNTYNYKSDLRLSYSLYRHNQPLNKLLIYLNIIVTNIVYFSLFLGFWKLMWFLVLYANQGPLNDNIKTIVIDGFNAYLK